MCLWEADTEDLRFPPLTWEACGTGCERAVVLAGLGTVASKPVIRIERGGGVDRAHLRFNHAMVSQSDGSLMAQRVVDLTTGRTIAAVLQAQTVSDGRAWCGASIHVSGGLEFVGFRAIDWEDASSDFQLRGSFDLATQRWPWQLPWPKAVDTTGCNKAAMEAGGRTFYLCPTASVAALTPGSSERTLVANLYDTEWLVQKPSALGDLIVWSEVDWETGNTRIRGWKPDGEGVRIVANGIALPTCAVALTDRYIAGFSTGGRCVSFEPGGRFWIGERTQEGGLRNVRTGPVFWPDPVTEVSYLKAWGEHVAIVWNEDIWRPDVPRHLVVARTSDWTMREVQAPEGHEAWEVGLDDDHLYVVFTRTGPGSGHFSHVYRCDLDLLDAIGVPLPPDESPVDP